MMGGPTEYLNIAENEIEDSGDDAETGDNV